MAVHEVPLVARFDGADYTADFVATKGSGEEIPVHGTVYLRLTGRGDTEIKVPVEPEFLALLLGQARDEDEPERTEAMLSRSSMLSPIPLAVKVIIDTDPAHHPL